MAKKAAKKKTSAKKATTKKKVAKKATKKAAAKKAAKKTTKKKATKKAVAKKTTKKAASKKAAKKSPAKKAAKKTTAKKTAKKATKKAAAKKTTKKKTKRQPNPAFMKALQPSEALAGVIGSSPLPRTQVIKKLWDYIKKNKLQDEKNRRMINADDKLRPVFGKDSVSMFEMTKVVNQHLK